MCNKIRENKRGSCFGRVLALLAGIAAVAGVVILVCKLLSKNSEDGSCPCRRFFQKLTRREDPDAADYAD